MKDRKNAKTAEEMIDIEVDKINSGKINESNLLRVVFLKSLKKQLENSWSKMLSSRDKEEVQFTWRAVSNQIDWLTTALLMNKSVEMSNDIDKMVDSKQKFTLEAIQALQAERDSVKAEYYRGVSDYERIMEEQEKYKNDGVFDSRIEMKAKDILNVIKTFDDEKRNAFWLEYFSLADKMIYTSQIQENPAKQKGE